MKKLKNYVRKIIDTIFIFEAKLTRTNLTFVGYYQKGIGKYGDDEITGESYVINNILKRNLQKNNPVFFDVGSNIGSYSINLKKNFPDANIFSFEPNPNTYKKIKKEALDTDIKFYNIGLGSNIGQDKIYDYEGQSGTEHASVYKEVLSDIHHSNNIEEIIFSNDTLDNFCESNNIDKIDFIKIDTEGSEFNVLIGAKNMLSNNKINIIQFEFNEMNVISRVFLKDYYNLLHNYDIYRLNTNKLIPIPTYKTENEIFKYQNFLAINKSYK